LEHSPGTLTECILRRLSHEPKTVVITYEKAISRALKSEKLNALKSLKSLKLVSENIKQLPNDSLLDISILTSAEGDVRVVCAIRLLMFIKGKRILVQHC